MGKYEVSELDEYGSSKLEKYKEDGEISLFNFNNNSIFYFYEKTETKGKNIVAYMNFCINEDNSMEIDEFEVVDYYRKKGIGTTIILDIQNEEDVKRIEVYPRTESAKKFWENCHFHEEKDDTNTPVMVWEK